MAYGVSDKEVARSTAEAQHVRQNLLGGSMKRETEFRSVLETAKPFLRYLDEAFELMELSTRGTHLLASQPALTEVLIKYHEGVSGEPDPTREEKLEESARLSALAAREIENGFPLLHAHALVGVWGALEAWIDDACVRWIICAPDLCDWGDRRLRVAPSELLEADEDHKAQVILAAVKSERISAQKLGVEQFESTLKVLGLGGHVPHRISEAIFQMQQIRHIYAHRAGIADATFVERCGNRLNCVAGERVAVSQSQMSEYAGAAVEYTHILHLRVEERLGNHVDWPDAFVE